MFGFIKNLFSGILSFLSGLLGGKKAEEKPEEKLPSTKPAAAELPGKVTGKTKRRSGYYMELQEDEDNKPDQENKSAKQNGSKTPEPVAAAKSAIESAKTPEPAKVELVQTDKGIKAEPVKATKLADTNGKAQTETTFAPKYLAPTASSGRRRPGPNMNSYLDMARQVKNPN